MAHVKLNVSLDSDVVDSLRRRAQETTLSVSGYLSQLIREDVSRAQDELAAEGYRELAEDLRSFAQDAMAIAHEVWPEWTERKESVTVKPRGARVGRKTAAR